MEDKKIEILKKAEAFIWGKRKNNADNDLLEDLQDLREELETNTDPIEFTLPDIEKIKEYAIGNLDKYHDNCLYGLDSGVNSCYEYICEHIEIKNKFLAWLDTEIERDTKEFEYCKIVGNASKGIPLENKVEIYKKIRKQFLLKK